LRLHTIYLFLREIGGDETADQTLIRAQETEKRQSDEERELAVHFLHWLETSRLTHIQEASSDVESGEAAQTTCAQLIKTT
jgi:hypothetical protein